MEIEYKNSVKDISEGIYKVGNVISRFGSPFLDAKKLQNLIMLRKLLKKSVELLNAYIFQIKKFDKHGEY